MKVSDFLSLADVSIEAAFADKRKLLEDLARRASRAVDLEPDIILAELRKREQLGSTGMGGGVALPDTQEGKQLGALACIARKLRDPDVLTALRHARDGGELYRRLIAD